MHSTQHCPQPTGMHTESTALQESMHLRGRKSKSVFMTAITACAIRVACHGGECRAGRPFGSSGLCSHPPAALSSAAASAWSPRLTWCQKAAGISLLQLQVTANQPTPTVCCHLLHVSQLFRVCACEALFVRIAAGKVCTL